jgi:hypothetical protein
MFPNIYVMLLGPQGDARKSSAINLGKPLIVRASDRPHIEDGSITAQSLMETMCELQHGKIHAIKRTTPSGLDVIDMDQMVETYGDKVPAFIAVIADEADVLFPKHYADIYLIPRLTRWWDCPDHFPEGTVGRGKKTAYFMGITMLGSTTESGLKKIFPPEVVHSGFGGRTVFVKRGHSGKENEENVRTPKMEAAEAVLQKDLDIISRLRGAYTLTEGAREVWKPFYLAHRRRGKLNLSPQEYVVRMTDYVQKLALIHAAGQSDDLRITKENMAYAIKVMEHFERTIMETTKQLDTTEGGEVLRFVREKIEQSGGRGVTRTILMNRVQHRLSGVGGSVAKHLDMIIEDLIAMKQIKKWHVPPKHGGTGSTKYKFIGKVSYLPEDLPTPYKEKKDE